MVQPDFHMVSCNRRRKPDPEIIELCLALERSKIDAVRESAEALHSVIAMMAKTGRHHESELPVADPETVAELLMRLNQHLYKTEGTHV